MGRSVVTDESEDGHDDVLGDRDDVGSSDLSNGDTAVSLVGSVEVDVVRTNTSSDGDLQVLGLGETLGGKVTGVERSGDDDLGIDELLVELGALTVLVGGGDESVALLLDPFSETELILCATEKSGLFLGVLASVVKDEKNFSLS